MELFGSNATHSCLEMRECRVASKNTVATVKNGSGDLMLLVCFSGKGTGWLILVKKGVKGSMYQVVLGNTSFHQGEHWWWCVAGSSSMTVIQNIIWRRKKHLKVVKWSSQSLDHNPMENLWMELRVSVAQWQPQNITSLQKICLEEWVKMSSIVCANLVKSYRKHVACLFPSEFHYKVLSWTFDQIPNFFTIIQMNSLTSHFFKAESVTFTLLPHNKFNWSSCIHASEMVWSGTLNCLPLAVQFSCTEPYPCVFQQCSRAEAKWSGGRRDKGQCIFNLEARRTDTAGRGKERQRARCLHRDTDRISPTMRECWGASWGQLICMNDRTKIATKSLGSVPRVFFYWKCLTLVRPFFLHYFCIYFLKRT